MTRPSAADRGKLRLNYRSSGCRDVVGFLQFLEVERRVVVEALSGGRGQPAVEGFAPMRP